MQGEHARQPSTDFSPRALASLPACRAVPAGAVVGARTIRTPAPGPPGSLGGVAPPAGGPSAQRPAGASEPAGRTFSYPRRFSTYSTSLQLGNGRSCVMR